MMNEVKFDQKLNWSIIYNKKQIIYKKRSK